MTQFIDSTYTLWSNNILMTFTNRLADLSRDEILAVMATVGFTEDGKAKPHHAVSTLSGGWRMKLAMARAMLQRADILLLDEVKNTSVAFCHYFLATLLLLSKLFFFFLSAY